MHQDSISNPILFIVTFEVLSGAIGVLHTKQQNRKNDSQDLWIPINGLKKDIHCLQYAF